jgi:hypothetical protein
MCDWENKAFNLIFATKKLLFCYSNEECLQSLKKFVPQQFAYGKKESELSLDGTQKRGK